MINSIKGQLQKFIGLKETYPSFTKEITKYSEDINKDFQIEQNSEIDIVMPTFNRLGITKRAIDYLFKTTKIKFNLIIVDNNSDLETKKYLKSIISKKIKVVFLHKNMGGSGSRMEGLKHVSSDLVAFVDNDIFPMPFYFENLLKTLKDNPELSAVQSKVVHPNRLIQINRPYYELRDGWIIFYDKDINKEYNDPSTENSEEVNWLPSGATIWRKSVFEKESFDSIFNTSFEDNEFAFRLSQKGYKFMNNHKAICMHLSSQFTPSSNSKTYTEARFGNEVEFSSLKKFKKKHNLFLSFGEPEEFAKYKGFESAEALKEFVLS